MDESLLFVATGAIGALHRCSSIVFDMDGVITDTEPLHARAEWETCRVFGLPVDLDEWHKFQGRTAQDIFGELRERFGTDATPSVVELICRKTDLYLDIVRRDGLPSVAGSVDFVRFARRHFDGVALATSSNSAVQGEMFRQFGIGDCFDVVVTGDDIAHGKPNPEAYLLAASRLGVAPESCVVVEDSDNGIKAASSAGCLVVGITTSFNAASLQAFGARIVISDYRGLKGLVQLVKSVRS